MAVGRAALGKVEDITPAVLVLRGRRALLDAELAVLYGVTTRRLNEQVRRNRKRFPDDFLFELATEEFANLKSRFATSSWGGRRKRPLAFTEHGAIQAATILNSPRAVEMSVYVVRAFVKLREVLSTNRELARRFEQLESRLESKLTEHDEAIAAILSSHTPIPDFRDGPVWQSSHSYKFLAAEILGRFPMACALWFLRVSWAL